jgi:hypothetical protein
MFSFLDASEENIQNCQEGIVINIEGKVYISPSNIYLSENQIYIRIGGELIPIQYLCCDDFGVYVSTEEIQRGQGRHGIWTCPKCGYENYDGINNCGQCGRDRHAKDGR